jgi:hypothetical protein
MTWVAPVSVEPSGMADPSPVPVPKPAVNAPSAEIGQGTAQGFGFKDFLDVINPLQHIPGISELYRAISGDRISEGARYSGNALYGLALGGPIGFSIMTGYSIASTAIGGRSDETSHEAEMEAAPVPREKPVSASEPPEVSSSGSGGEVLGAEIARVTGPGNGAPFDLTALLTGVSPASKPETAPVQASQEKPDAVSPEEGLDKIAAHKDNHLPIDVLKALQERYLARANDESA